MHNRKGSTIRIVWGAAATPQKLSVKLNFQQPLQVYIRRALTTYCSHTHINTLMVSWITNLVHTCKHSPSPTVQHSNYIDDTARAYVMVVVFPRE